MTWVTPTSGDRVLLGAEDVAMQIVDRCCMGPEV